ncbi:hypothetical protein D9M70_518500 [compost metagenome]
MARSAGWVDHLEVEDRSDLSRGRVGLFLGLLEYRIECAVEQRLHQTVGCVIAPTGFAGIAVRAVVEVEDIIGAQLWGNFQQALVDAAQLLRLKIAPVDTVRRAIAHNEAEVEQRIQKATIADLRAIHHRCRLGGEQAT